MVLKPVPLQQGCTDKMVGEGEALPGVSQNGVADLQREEYKNIEKKIDVSLTIFFFLHLLLRQYTVGYILCTYSYGSPGPIYCIFQLLYCYYLCIGDSTTLNK